MGAKLSACAFGPARSHDQLQGSGAPCAPAYVPESVFNIALIKDVPAEVSEPADTFNYLRALMLPSSTSAVRIYRKVTGAVKDVSADHSRGLCSLLPYPSARMCHAKVTPHACSQEAKPAQAAVKPAVQPSVIARNAASLTPEVREEDFFASEISARLREAGAAAPYLLASTRTLITQENILVNVSSRSAPPA